MERALLRARCQGSTTAAGHVAYLPQDSQRDECHSATPWSFPLAPKGGPQSQSDPASEWESGVMLEWLD
jgi:hypothetical protein